MVRGLSMGRTLPTRTHDGALSFRLLPRTRSRSHAIVRVAATRWATTTTRRPTARIYVAIYAGPHGLLFPLASSACFSLTSDLPKERRSHARVTTSTLMGDRACMRASIFTRPRRENPGLVLGKTFSGTCENRASKCEIKLAAR